jgi:hypothetical protein
MSQTMKPETFTAPACWACYLINSDASGLGAAEKSACDRWLAEISPWEVSCVAAGVEPRFTWFYRLYGGAADSGEVIDYVVFWD